MRILYLANHAGHDNDDEGAIAHALTQLGHDVICVHEDRKHRRSLPPLRMIQADFCLYHKCPTVGYLMEIRCPKVGWFFDMVEPIDGDPTLTRRSEARKKWIREASARSLLMFCTDGDWVERQGVGKYYWLMQGADERVVGLGTPKEGAPPIMFHGMVNHGQKRAAHVQRLRERWGDRFFVLGDGGPRYRRHGRELANLLAAIQVAVAPDGPSTDRYWSNRVYQVTGFGGMLIHPYCEGLNRYFLPGELACYKDRDECDSLIQKYLEDRQSNEQMRQAGLKATLERNLYRHRCAELIRVVERRL